jgi:hypothetical protein
VATAFLYLGKLSGLVCFVLLFLPNEPVIGSPNGRGYLRNFHNVKSGNVSISSISSSSNISHNPATWQQTVLPCGQ